MSGAQILDALDKTWASARKFIMERVDRLSLSEEERGKLDMAMGMDVLMVIPQIEAFVFKHEGAIIASDEKYFRALLRREDLPIEEAECKRAFLLMRIFLSLLTDLRNEDEESDEEAQDL